MSFFCFLLVISGHLTLFSDGQPTILPSSKELYTNCPADPQSLEAINQKLDTIISRTAQPPWNQKEWVESAKMKYKISTEQKTWEEARRNCQLTGGDLISLKSVEQLVPLTALIRDFVLKTGDIPIPNTRHYWTSGYEFPIGSNKWFWAKDNSSIPLNSIMWRPGEPNNAYGNENCLHLYPGVGNLWLNDHNCTWSINYICEY